MQKLLTALTPLAPDQSGAVAALFELGGIIIICDAGGCTGNICGFDEPRWWQKKSAVFSLGLRDIDAILGRDDRLLEKTSALVSKFQANFVALIGTPVPTVIATDYAGLAKIGAKKFQTPMINVPCTGTRYYDLGAEQAWLALAEKVFAEQVASKQDFTKQNFKQEIRKVRDVALRKLRKKVYAALRKQIERGYPYLTLQEREFLEEYEKEKGADDHAEHL